MSLNAEIEEARNRLRALEDEAAKGLTGRVGQVLKKAREAKGWSILQASRRITRVSRQTVTNAENGANMTLRVLQRMANAYGTTPADVLRAAQERE